MAKGDESFMLVTLLCISTSGGASGDSGFRRRQQEGDVHLHTSAGTCSNAAVRTAHAGFGPRTTSPRVMDHPDAAGKHNEAVD